MANKKTVKFFLDDLAQGLASLGAIHAKPAVLKASKTLAEGLTTRNLQRTGNAAVTIPHFWAVFVHDGRGRSIVPKNSSVLIWYRNKADDPRFTGSQTPKRASQIKRLTASQLKRGLAAGKIIIAKKVSKPVPGHFFFNNNGGMAGFDKRAGNIAKREFSAFVKSDLNKLLKVKGEITILL